MSSKPNTGPRYLLRWDHSRRLEVGRDVVVTPHRLSELSLGDEQRLIDLLDEFPRTAISVHTMGTNPAHPNERRFGSVGRLPGGELFRAVEQGRLVITLNDVATHSKDFKQATHRLLSEIAECHVGFRIHRPSANLIIASPKTIEYCSCVPQPSITWQIRGRRHFWTYPSEPRFLHPQSAEEAIVTGQPKVLYFEPDFDLSASTFTIEAEQMCSLPYLTPSRTETGDTVSVWLQTRFDTTQSLRRQEVLLANQRLRAILPEFLCGDETASIWSTLKAACGKAIMNRTDQTAQITSETTFVVDPKTVGGIGSVESQAPTDVIIDPLNETQSAYSAGTGLDTTTTPVVLEN